MSSSKNLDDLNKKIKELEANLYGLKNVKPFKDLNEAKKRLQELNIEANSLNSQLSYVADSLKDSVNELSKQNNYLTQAKKSMRDISSISGKLLSIRRGEVDASAEDIVNLQRKAKLRYQELKQAKEKGNLSTAERLEIDGALKSLDSFIAGSQEVLEIQKAINRNAGFKSFEFVADVVKAIPGLRKLSTPFEKAAKAAQIQARYNKINFGKTRGQGLLKSIQNKRQRKADLEALKTGKGLNKQAIERLGLEDKLVSKKGKALAGTAAAKKAAKEGMEAEVEGLAKSTSPLVAGFKSIGSSISAALGPIALLTMAIKFIIDAFLEVDKLTADLAKNLGVSQVEAVKVFDANLALADKLREQGGIYEKLNLNAKQLTTSTLALNEQFGTSAKFGDQLTAEFTAIKFALNLSEETMKSFAGTAVATGTSMKDNLEIINDTTMQLIKDNKLALNQRKIQESIGKISKSILLNSRRNFKELTKSVFAAKRLGIEMSGLESIQGNLLNFEQSIQSELEAELLLGKELNLEKARLAALQGDMATLGKEILSNEAIMEAFSSGNVISQEAAAKALGMSREELAKMIDNQQQLSALQQAFGQDFTSISEAQQRYNELKMEGRLNEEEGLALKAELEEQGLLNQFEALAKQEEFNQLIQQLKDQLFTPIATNLLKQEGTFKRIFEIVKMIVKNFKTLLMIYVAIKAAQTGFKIGQMVSLALTQRRLRLAQQEAVTEGVIATAKMTSASAGSLGMGMIPIIAGIGAGVAALLAAYAMIPSFHKGGMVGGSSSLQNGEVPAILQTGEFVVSREGVNSMGTNNLNAINKGKTSSSSSTSSTSNASSLIAKMEDFVTKIPEMMNQQLAQTPINVNTTVQTENGDKIGESIVQATFQTS